MFGSSVSRICQNVAGGAGTNNDVVKLQKNLPVKIWTGIYPSQPGWTSLGCNSAASSRRSRGQCRSVCSRQPAFPPGIPPAVDPADAGFQLVDNSVSAVEVGRHHAGGEAVFGGVGAANDLRFVGIAEDRHHRAEDLFAHDGHLVAAIGKHRQGDPRAVIENRRLSAPRRRTAGARLRVCRSRYSAERCRDGGS